MALLAGPPRFSLSATIGTIVNALDLWITDENRF